MIDSIGIKEKFEEREYEIYDKVLKWLTGREKNTRTYIQEMDKMIDQIEQEELKHQFRIVFDEFQTERNEEDAYTNEMFYLDGFKDASKLKNKKRNYFFNLICNKRMKDKKIAKRRYF